MFAIVSFSALGVVIFILEKESHCSSVKKENKIDRDLRSTFFLKNDVLPLWGAAPVGGFIRDERTIVYCPLHYKLY